MGNRAVITTKNDFEKDGIGVYLHWNGGRDSVEAFLKYCEIKKYREPEYDCYGYARLCQIIGNFLGRDTGLGVDKINQLDYDNHDNGTYIIKDWKIVDRKYFKGIEQSTYDLFEMVCDIDAAQPEKEQLGREKIQELFEAEENPKF